MLVTQDVALAQAAPIIVVENPRTTAFDIFFVYGHLIGADSLQFTHGDWKCFGHATGRVRSHKSGASMKVQNINSRSWVATGLKAVQVREMSTMPLAIQGCAALCTGGNCLSRRDPSQSW
jgi:hypothetical protein